MIGKLALGAFAGGVALLATAGLGHLDRSPDQPTVRLHPTCQHGAPAIDVVMSGFPDRGVSNVRIAVDPLTDADWLGGTAGTQISGTGGTYTVENAPKGVVTVTVQWPAADVIAVTTSTEECR